MKATKVKIKVWVIFISFYLLQTLQLFSTDIWAQTTSVDSIITTDSLTQDGTYTENIDTPIIAEIPDTTQKTAVLKQWVPNPTRATWLAVVFPGAGQIYNRKYWKLPIFYGGFAGCAYALSWNNNTYKDYSRAYRDLMSDDPNKNSYEDLLPPNHGYSKSQLETVLKNRKDRFRRYRDLSIFAFIGVYVLSIIDAYVDAELSNFDISPDLSMRIEPAIMNNQNIQHNSKKSVGVQCSFTF